MEDGSEKYHKRKLNSEAPKTREIKVDGGEKLKQERNVEFWKNRYGESAARTKRLQEKINEAPQSQENKPIVTKWSESYKEGEQVGSYPQEPEPKVEDVGSFVSRIPETSNEDLPPSPLVSQPGSEEQPVGQRERSVNEEVSSEQQNADSIPSLPERQPNEPAMLAAIRMLAKRSIGYLKRNPEQRKLFDKKIEEVGGAEPQKPPLPPMPAEAPTISSKSSLARKLLGLSVEDRIKHEADIREKTKNW